MRQRSVTILLRDGAMFFDSSPLTIVAAFDSKLVRPSASSVRSCAADRVECGVSASYDRFVP